MREKRRPVAKPGGSRTIDHPQSNGPLLPTEERNGNRVCTFRGNRARPFPKALDAAGFRYHQYGSQTQAQCPVPGHKNGDRDMSLTIYRKPDRIKIVCHIGHNDELDILPLLGMTWHDKLDAPHAAGAPVVDSRVQARIEARRNMTAPQRATDDLLNMPDFAERFARCLIKYDNAERLRAANETGGRDMTATRFADRRVFCSRMRS